MKRLSIYFVFFLCLIVFPIVCNAASLGLVSDTANISPSNNVTITVNAKEFSTKYGSIHFDVSYDSSKFSYKSSKALQGELTEDRQDGKVSITIDKENGMDNGGLYQITLTSLNTAVSGESKVVISSTNDCFDLNLSMISVTGDTLIFNHYVASTIDTLSSLSVSNCELSPKFKSDTLNYMCPETTLSEVMVTGSVTDSKAKVIGLGVKKLEYGNNNISVIVTSESGSKKKYNINITRKDIRSDNNSLASLEVVGYNLNFDPNILEYNLEIGKDVTSITINGTSLESTSTVTGLGEVELNNDYNSFFITVSAENGGTKVYRINVTKKEQVNASSTLLSFLSFNDIEIKLTEERTYLIGVNSSTTSLDLKYLTKEEGVECEVVGNDNFKEGINVVKLILKADGTIDTTYTLLVYKESALTLVTDFKEVNEISTNYFYNNKSFASTIIPKSFLEKLENNFFKYNLVNEYGGLLTSFKFTKDSIVDDDLEIVFSKISGNNLSYSSNIPRDVLITLYLEDISNEIKIYNYNNGVYTLMDTVTVKDGYIEFLSNGSDNYVFSEKPLFGKLQKSELTIVQIIGIFIAGIVIGTILAYYFGHNRRRKIELEFTKL